MAPSIANSDLFPNSARYFKLDLTLNNFSSSQVSLVSPCTRNELKKNNTNKYMDSSPSSSLPQSSRLCSECSRPTTSFTDTFLKKQSFSQCFLQKRDDIVDCFHHPTSLDAFRTNIKKEERNTTSLKLVLKLKTSTNTFTAHQRIISALQLNRSLQFTSFPKISSLPSSFLYSYLLFFLLFLFCFYCQTAHAQYGYYDQQFAPGFGPLLPNPQVDTRLHLLRDMEGRPIFDPLQPDPNKPKPAFYQRSYEHSDQRCRDLLMRGNYEEYVHVLLRFGKVIGRIAYLCDHLELNYRERPLYGEQLNRLQFDSLSNRFSGSLPRIRGNISVFLGVPFARPPTRDAGLRFKPPQPPLQHGSIDASKFKPACPQARRHTGESKMIPEMDEDCLYLNIYSPFVLSRVRVPYPVMVYLHGGNFQSGTGNTFPGYQLALSQQVIVVTINYRLGLFGFLATGDQHSPGNYGLLDQQQALFWLRENIVQFNGDPERITLFGPGAGAASAGFLAVSPLSRRLVRRVIAQSGSMGADWALQTDFIQIQNSSRAAAKQFGCPEHSSEQLVRCFNAKSYAIALEEAKPEIGWLPFTPVLDRHTRRPEDQVLPDRPEVLLAEATSAVNLNPINALNALNSMNSIGPSFSGIDDRLESANELFDAYLTGVARDDGLAKILEDPSLASRQFQVDREVFKVKVKDYLNIFNETINEKALLDAIEFMYSPWADRNNLTLWRQGLIDMYSDSWHLAGVDKMLKLLVANNVRSYMYVLNYTLQGLSLPEWYGVPHDTEFLLASGGPFMDYRFYPAELKLNQARWTEADRNMSSFFMQSWANFAKYGNPTPVSVLNQFLWRTTGPQMEYLSVNSTNQTNIMFREYRQKQSQFWNEYIHQLRGIRPRLWPLELEPLHEEIRVYRAFTWAVLLLLVVLFFLTVLCSCLYCRAKRFFTNEGSDTSSTTNFAEHCSQNKY